MRRRSRASAWRCLGRTFTRHRWSTSSSRRKAAMAGAFHILEQLNEGADGPEDEDYICVEVGGDGDGLHGVLSRLELLYERCGGAAKAFSSAAMRRHLTPLVGHGGLEKHDFDNLSRRFRDTGTRFVSHERENHQALRFFEFVGGLKQLTARAFPGAAREGLERALRLLGA
mmetsp:Transcript_9862/g.27719  ORF Transcript_9862/g.27719 Transcript_9862/m.27719 type:complete len:171 (-) Transcript_9862:27-539(-)